ncbi:MAG: S-layer homology domain-containing protein [Bacillota bacterium]|nr:S-layer homology domain-containing protein [Bacillota bacterium]
MKKIISITLCICLMLSAVISPPTAFGADSMSKIIDGLLTYSAEERANLFTFLKPLLIVDKGLDLIDSYIDNYDPSGGDVASALLAPIFQYIEPQDAKTAISVLRLIPEDTRKKYADIYQNRTETPLTTDEANNANSILLLIYEDYPNLQTLFDEDGITSGVLLNFLGIFSEINDSKPMLSYSDSYFSVNYVSSTFESSLNSLSTSNGDPISLKKLAEETADRLNTVTTDAKPKIAELLQKTGVCVIQNNDSEIGSPTSSDWNENGLELKVENADTTASEKSQGYVKAINVSVYSNNDKQPDGLLPQSCVISFTCDNPLMTLHDTDGNVVLLSTYENGKFTARIEKSGRYLIKQNSAPFKDNNGWGTDYINQLALRGIVGGKGDGLFSPNDKISREEFVKLIVKLFNLQSNDNPGFADVNSSDWYFPYVSSAYKAGIINGVGDNKFGVGQPITRQDLCKIIYNAASAKNLFKSSNTISFKDSSNIASYALDAVTALNSSGYIAGDENSNFNPSSNATRQEAAKILYYLLRDLTITK